MRTLLYYAASITAASRCRFTAVMQPSPLFLPTPISFSYFAPCYSLLALFASLTSPMKILSLILVRALPQETESTTLASAYMLDEFNFFQKER